MYLLMEIMHGAATAVILGSRPHRELLGLFLGRRTLRGLNPKDEVHSARPGRLLRETRSLPLHDNITRSIWYAGVVLTS